MNTDRQGEECIALPMHYAVNDLKIKHSGSTVHSRVTISMGVACLVPGKRDTSQSLIALADKAFIRPKAKGGIDI